MARRSKLDIVINTNSRKAVRGIGKITTSLAGMAKKLVKIGALGATALGAGLTAAAVKSVAAFAEQEKAVNALESAFASFGEDADALMPKFEALAAAIQDETAAADENTLQMMATIRNLGVMPKDMEKATKGALGLAKALNLNAESSARYTALALQGETTILQRYLPALRSAETEHEKMRIVTDAMNRGYRQMRAELTTTGGRWRELKGRIGDATEGIGEAIVKGSGLRDIMDEWSEKIKEFENSESFKAIQARISDIIKDANKLLKSFFDDEEGLAIRMDLKEKYEPIWDKLVDKMDEWVDIAAPLLEDALIEGATAAFKILKGEKVTQEDIHKGGRATALALEQQYYEGLNWIQKIAQIPVASAAYIGARGWGRDTSDYTLDRATERRILSDKREAERQILRDQLTEQRRTNERLDGGIGATAQ